jgi:hypothetical protein
MADVSFRTDKVVRLSALCAQCEAPMHRIMRRADLAALASIIDLRTPAQERLNDCSNPSVDGVFEKV